MLDTKTLLISITLINLYLAITLFAYGRSQKTYPGFGFWQAATTMVALTYILLLLRGVAPDWLTIPVANTIVMTSAVFRIEGMKRFVDRGRFNYWNFWMPALTFIWYCYFTYAQNSIAMRNALFTTLTIIFIARLSTLALASPWDKTKGITYFFIGIMIVDGIFMAIRAVGLFADPSQSLTANTIFNSIYFLVALIADISWTVCYILLNGQRTTVEVQRLTDELLRAAADRQSVEENLHEKQLQMIALEERERMGRDLHDGLGQVMGYVNLQAQVSQMLIDEGKQDEVKASLQRISELAQSAYADIRSLLIGLRSPESKKRENLFAALQARLEQLQQETGIATKLSLPESSGQPTLPPATEEQILRIVQEALTNVRKHSAATQVEIFFEFQPRQILLVISDNGKGVDLQEVWSSSNQEHFGLGIMRERAEVMGGKLEMRSAPGDGLKIIVTIPRAKREENVFSAEGLKRIRGLRVLLVDDSALFLEGLHGLLLMRAVPVVGVARDGLEAQEKARALKPDLIVMDVRMPRCDGLEALRKIKAELPEVKVVMLTVDDSDENLLEALSNGAAGYLMKNMSPDEFCDALDAAAQGEMLLTPESASRIAVHLAGKQSSAVHTRSSDAELTPRQWQILDLVAGGMTYKEIAHLLNLSEPTIKYHMAQILEQLHLETRMEAIAYAKRVRQAK